MDALVRQRVNEILNEKIAMGAGEGGYGTSAGAKKAVKTKRAIAKVRRAAAKRRAPAKRAPAKRRVCAAGEGYGGYGTAAGAAKRMANMKAKNTICELKAENKELKQEVKEAVKEIKVLEKIVEAPMKVKKTKRAPISKWCKERGFRPKVCRELYPEEAYEPTEKQKAARERFANMSRAASALMRDYESRGQHISRQEAICLVTGDASKKCKKLYPNREPAEGYPMQMAPAPMEAPIQLVQPGEIVPQEMMIGSGGRYRRRYGRGDMGYGTVMY
jgi:hypothetical protein